jgi:uncharacterized protein YxeA
MNLLKKILIIIGITLVALFIVGLIFRQDSTTNDDGSTVREKIITHNPFNMSQIKAVSKYRSCEGHNYSGYNAEGEKEEYRTMKHYIDVSAKFSQTTQLVEIYAPFNGKVSQIGSDSRGSQVYLSPSSKSNGWDLIFFHIDLLPKFNKIGEKIISGELIGFANLANTSNFDIAMKYFGPKGQKSDSPFFYMNEAVLSEYSSFGITLENIITPKKERDDLPCQLAPGETGRDAFYARSEAGKNWIQLER